MSGAPTRRFFGRDRPPVSAKPPEKGRSTRVRPCTEADLSQIEAILERSPEAGVWTARGLAEALEQDRSHFLVGWQYKEIAGFISGRQVLDEGEILNLAVKPELRRKRVGEALVEELLEVFAKDRVVKVFLEVRESNTAAIAFYQRMNFRLTGKRPAYYKNPVEAALVLLRTEEVSASTG